MGLLSEPETQLEILLKLGGNFFFSLVSGCVSGMFFSPTAQILITATENPLLVQMKPFSSFKEAEDQSI